MLCFLTCSVEWDEGTIQENGGKLASTVRTCEGIPACGAEIGNWTVVIIGCGIDVVPINQNCWINKNCSRFLCHGGVQKMFELLALPSLIMVQYLQQWFGEVLPGFCLSIALLFTLSNYLSIYLPIHLCFCLSVIPSIYPSVVSSIYPSITRSISLLFILSIYLSLSLKWSTFTHLKQCQLLNTQVWC